MKKLLTLLSLLGVLYSSLPAQQTDLNQSPAANNDLGALGITTANGLRLDLFATDAQSRKAQKAVDRKWTGFVVNLVAGVGIGSYIQGDPLGGTIGLVGEVGSLALMLYGSYPVEGPGEGKKSYDNLPLMYLGMGTFIATRIFEMVRPFTYANKMEKMHLSVAPTLDEKGNLGFTSSVSLKL